MARTPTQSKGRTSTRRVVRVLPKQVRGSYDAAVTTDGNRRHWANADALSPDAAASVGVRRSLRIRARYEVANNSYARGIVNTLANDVVGTGPRLQMLMGDASVDRTIEAAFNRWAREIRLAEKLRIMRQARAESGECFVLIANNDKLTSKVKLDIKLIEPDQVTTPDLNIINTRQVVDGIVFDDFGNPVEYHILKEHPGSINKWTIGLEYDKVAADVVIHYFRADRPGQSRGIPDITPALPLFAQLRRFTLAVLDAAETAANFAAVMYTDAPADGDADEVDPMESFDIERNMLTTLPSGWKIGQIDATQPSTTYAEFKRELLNEIARCLNMPFNVAAGNSSGYNYASGRLDHQTYFKSIRIEQSFIESVVLDRLFDAWFAEAVRVEGLLPQAARMRDVVPTHQWFWDGTEHVDPAKEANAQAIRLRNRTTSLAREFARQGLDWEAELDQIAKEQAKMKALGITIDPIKATAQEIVDDENA